jgi:peptidyl-prolyl cis-trans isomerase SurA
MKPLLPILLLLAAYPARAEIIDRIAAVVDRQVITLSELNQIVELEILPPAAGEDPAAYRRRVLDRMITQVLRYRDVERFGAGDVPADSIEATLRGIIARYPSEEAFMEALARVELTLDQVRTLIKRNQQVQRFIDERFAPLIFVSLDEIETHYDTVWAPARRAQGLPVPPLSQVREQMRRDVRQERLDLEIERWTDQLRSRANIDIFVF